MERGIHHQRPAGADGASRPEPVSDRPGSDPGCGAGGHGGFRHAGGGRRNPRYRTETGVPGRRRGSEPGAGGAGGGPGRPVQAAALPEEADRAETLERSARADGDACHLRRTLREVRAPLDEEVGLRTCGRARQRPGAAARAAGRDGGIASRQDGSLLRLRGREPTAVPHLQAVHRRGAVRLPRRQHPRPVLPARRQRGQTLLPSGRPRLVPLLAPCAPSRTRAVRLPGPRGPGAAAGPDPEGVRLPHAGRTVRGLHQEPRRPGRHARHPERPRRAVHLRGVARVRGTRRGVPRETGLRRRRPPRPDRRELAGMGNGVLRHPADRGYGDPARPRPAAEGDPPRPPPRGREGAPPERFPLPGPREKTR